LYIVAASESDEGLVSDIMYSNNSGI